MATVLQTDVFRWEMRAAREPLIRRAAELDPLRPGDALVRVVGCGVCHTDVGFLYDGVRTRHSLPLALGHEISGEVIAVGGGWEELVGKAVIVPAVTPCGNCDACRNGMAAICPKQIMPGNDVHGGFASHVVVPAHGLCVVDAPGALTGEVLARSGCTLAELSVVADAVTTPYQAIRRSNLRAGELAIVIGLGGVGGFAAQIAKAFGAVVVGFDVDASRLEQMKSHGVELALDASARDVDQNFKEVRAFAERRGLAPRGWRIYECSGSKCGQALAWRMVGPGAHLSVIGFTLDKLELRLSNLMAFDAVAAGNWGCLPELYPAALQLVLDGRVAVRPFVKTFAMDRVADVLEDVHQHRLHQRPVLVP